MRTLPPNTVSDRASVQIYITHGEVGNGVQVRLTGFAPTAPTLMGALNLAALNLANSLGAIGGAVTIHAGGGALSTVCAGFVLTVAGLLLYVTTIARRPVRKRHEKNCPV